MALKNPFKLEKLKIKAYKNRKRSDSKPGDLVGTFGAMFNPESWQEKYAIEYGKNQGLNSSGKEVDYARSKPSDLNLKLILDGTGVTEFGILRLRPQKTVSEQVKEFVALTFQRRARPLRLVEPLFLRAIS